MQNASWILDGTDPALHIPDSFFELQNPFESRSLQIDGIDQNYLPDREEASKFSPPASQKGDGRRAKRQTSRLIGALRQKPRLSMRLSFRNRHTKTVLLRGNFLTCQVKHFAMSNHGYPPSHTDSYCFGWKLLAQLAIGRLRQYESTETEQFLGPTKSDAAGNDPLPSKANYTVYRSARTSLWKDVDNLI
uniref:Pkinase_fungal domain-containing protein n=1 Tax=Heterorhabditis bacteriophora TaxID=37862 RepID=A0A1I7WQP1_HETBA